MNKRLKRILGVYALGLILGVACSLIYYYFRSNLVFLSIILFVFLVSYLMPLWFKLLLKTKSYYGRYRAQLLNFAEAQGIYLNNIYVRNSKHSNACAFGLWNNKAVTFNSLTLEKHPWDEIEGVMAHEMGHHARFGIYVYTALVAFILILLSWSNVEILNNFSGSLLHLLSICIITSTIALPVVLAISRFMEGQADRFALGILKNPSSMSRFLIRMMKYEEEAGETWSKNPTFLTRLFLTHPWIYDRIKLFKAN